VAYKEVWVFWGGFFRWVYPKKPTGFFWVCTRVSEPCFSWIAGVCGTLLYIRCRRRTPTDRCRWSTSRHLQHKVQHRISRLIRTCHH